MSRETILDKARQIPVEELTMQRLAQEMGVHTSSLYRHVESRDALFVELVKDRIEAVQLGEFEPSKWRSWLKQAGMELYDVFADHPLVLYVDITEINMAGIEVFTEPVVANLRSIGVSTEEAARAWLGVIGLCYGAAAMTEFEKRGAEQRKIDYERLLADEQFRQRAPHSFELLLADPWPYDLRERLSEMLDWYLVGFERSVVRKT